MFRGLRNLCSPIQIVTASQLPHHCSEMSEAQILADCRKLVPGLLDTSHKGSCGRSGVFGGSVEFTGAPYFAAISSLRTGADLAYVFTASSAAPVIKSYSPELMVMPFLDEEKPLSLIAPWLTRLHAVLIGPGLGRNPKIFETISGVLDYLSTEENHRPLVFDADGLYFIMQNLNFLETYPGTIYLTPNCVEFKNLAKAIFGEPHEKSLEDLAVNICEKYGDKLTLVVKGQSDLICNDGKVLLCNVHGSARRCGGQGDMLSGVLTTFASWVAVSSEKVGADSKYTGSVLAGYSACALTRTSNRIAFESRKRSMLVTDMLEVLHNSFDMMFDNPPDEVGRVYC